MSDKNYYYYDGGDEGKGPERIRSAGNTDA